MQLAVASGGPVQVGVAAAVVQAEASAEIKKHADKLNVKKGLDHVKDKIVELLEITSKQNYQLIYLNLPSLSKSL